MNNIKFDFNKFKNNILFIIISIALVIGVLGFGIWFQGASRVSAILPEQNNPDDDIDVSELVISELMTSNDGAIADANGKSFDWVELYNGTNSDINLKNYGLSKKENTTQWFFSDVVIMAKSYLVVFFSGKNQNGLYANFKLSSGGGETLTMRNPGGNIIETVETSTLRKNWSMALDEKGEWFTTESCTPGFANSKTGREAYVQSLVSENTSGVIISEFLPKNKGNFYQDNTLPSFIEIQNTSNLIVNLSDFTLSGDLAKPFRYSLPDVYLGPKDYFVLYLADIVSDRFPYYANWSLDNVLGNCILGYKGKIVQLVSYNSLANGLAYSNQEGNFYASSAISPGYVNTSDGSKNFARKNQPVPADLVINEVMSSNFKYLAQNGGNYYDWIEIKNNTNSDINLSDYSLSNNYSFANMYQLPDKVLKAGEMMVFMASGSTILTNSSYYHLNFKLGSDEGVFLFKSGKYVDSLFVSNLPIGYSYGRGEGSDFYYMSQPTPNAVNSEGLVDVASVPIPSQKAGVYNGVDSVTVSFQTPGTIYYTTNGSKPTTGSNVYTGPFSLKKTRALRLINVEAGKVKSPVMTYSYIINEKHTMPVMSLSMDKSRFNSMRLNRGGNTEIGTSIEYFDDSEGFSIDAGIRLFGGQTRFMSKQSFMLKFRKKYGDSSLQYPVFPDKTYTVFEDLVLRSSSQDSDYAMIRDTVSASLNIKYDTKCLVQKFKYIILYINGSYYGVYNIREKVNQFFVANNFNVNPSSANIVRNDGKVTDGSGAGHRQLKNYIIGASMSSSAAYNYVAKRINMESYADMWVGIVYSTNNDMVNLRMVNSSEYDEGRFYGVLYDLDWAFYNYTTNYFTHDMMAGSFYDGSDTIISRGLMKNSQFRKLFLERLVYGMHNQWKKANVLKEIEEQYKLLKPEMSRERKRWSSSLSDWEASIKEFKTYVNRREKYMLSHIKSVFHLSAARMKELFGDL